MKSDIILGLFVASFLIVIAFGLRKFTSNPPTVTV